MLLSRIYRTIPSSVNKIIKQYFVGQIQSENIFDPWPGEQRTDFTPSFAVGAGRSGTHFLYTLMQKDPSLLSFHTDTIGYQIQDSFLRYCEWYRLPVDIEGFLESREKYISRSFSLNRVYFEANALISLSLMALYERFRARFIFILRNPVDTVNSHFVKGWYSDLPPRKNPELAHGLYFTDRERLIRTFARILPRGREYEKWRQLTQIGRIAWTWNKYNLEIQKRLAKLPENNYRILNLENIDYAMYLDIHAFVGGRLPLEESEFDMIRAKKPGKGKWKKGIESWSEQEKKEFYEQTEEARNTFGMD